MRRCYLSVPKCYLSKSRFFVSYTTRFFAFRLPLALPRILFFDRHIQSPKQTNQCTYIMDDDKTLIEMSPSPAPTVSRSTLQPDILGTISQRERHPTLWYPNGTVVLATGPMLFRVYDGILAHHSPVFREMFQDLSVKSDDGYEREMVDDVPVVQLEDDVIEFGHFLNTLFDRS